MQPITLISKTIQNIKLPCNTINQICCVTGLNGECVPRKYLIGKSFTNLDLLKNPNSQFVSVEAYRVLKYKKQRNSSWFCDGEKFKQINKAEVRNIIFKKNMPKEWCAYVTTSYKKHGALKTVVNTGRKRIFLFETQLIDCSDLDQLKKWWKQLNKFLLLGFNKVTLRTLRCSPYLIKKIGFREWIKLKIWAENKYNSAIYQFLCYLLPNKEELKKLKK